MFITTPVFTKFRCLRGLGTEAAGVVQAVGPRDTDYKEGERGSTATV